MKHSIITYLSCLSLVALLFSCTKVQKGSDKEGDIINFSFSLIKPDLKSAQGESNMPSTGFDVDINATNNHDTKAIVGEVDDSKVMNIWALQFDGTDDAAKLVKASYAKAENISGMDLNNIQLFLKSGKGQTVCFVTNLFDANLFKGTNAAVATYTLADFKAARATIASQADAVWNKYKVLPMGGIFTGDLITGLPSSENSIKLYRLAARVRMSYNIQFPPSQEFSLESVSIENIPTSFYYNANPENTTVKTDIEVYSQPLEAKELSGSLIFYMPENIQGIVATNTHHSQKDGITGENNKPKATHIKIVGLIPGENDMYKRATLKVYLGGDPIKSYNVNSNKDYTINTRITGLSTSDTRVTIEQTTLPMVEIRGRSNCYAVSKATKAGIGIPVSQVNTYKKGSIGANDKWIAEILWQTNASQGNDNNKGTVIEFDKNTGTGADDNSASSDKAGFIRLKALVDEGNAVIALYKADDKGKKTGSILWSWHIWVTAAADGINNGTQGHTYAGSNAFVMDRALGASSAKQSDGQKTYGLYYQWGRKDPFPMAKDASNFVTTYQANGSTVYSAPSIVTTQNVAYAVANPATYIKQPSSPYDWTSPQDNNLWKADSKTVYDPCPEGWRVAPNGTWNTFSGQTSGFNQGFNFSTGTNGNTWFPASGGRLNGAGSIGFVTSGGYYWSATFAGTNAYSLYFSSGYVDPSNGDTRATGFAVRCVKN